jgi:hypothetical protein
MLFINTDANHFPAYLGDVQLSDPTYEPGGVLPQGWFEVEPAQPPILAENEVIENSYAEVIDNQYVQRYTIRQKSDDEMALDNQLVAMVEELMKTGISQGLAVAEARKLIDVKSNEGSSNA